MVTKLKATLTGLLFIGTGALFAASSTISGLWSSSVIVGLVFIGWGLARGE